MPSRRITLGQLAVIFAAWTAFGLLSAAQAELLLALRNEDRPLWSVLGPSLIGSWIWACYTPALMLLARYLRGVRERQRTRARGWLVFFGAHLAILAVGVAVDTVVWASVRPLIDGTVVPLGRVFASTLLVNIGAYLTVVTLTEAIDYAARWRERERAAAALARTAETLRHQLDEARLRALESQLRPHFLYNTLNLIAELVHEEPEAADQMLTHLGALLRRSYSESAHLVPLDEEIHFVRAYAEILARRYRDRATLTISIPVELRHAPVPAFLLQPLVENAFRHGVESQERASIIEVSARPEGDALEIRVRNRSLGASRGWMGVEDWQPTRAEERLSELRHQEGVGLRNTRERLSVLYGTAAGLTLAQGRQETVALVWLPFEPGATADSGVTSPVPERVGA
jgi:two-component system LytT family sensor kinase